MICDSFQIRDGVVVISNPLPDNVWDEGDKLDFDNRNDVDRLQLWFNESKLMESKR